MADSVSKRKIQVLEQELDYLKQIIAHIPCNVYWKDRKGRYLGHNQNASKTIGLNPEETFIGKTLHEIIDPEIAKVIDKTDRRIMRENKEERIEEDAIDIHQKPATYLSIKAPLFNKKHKVSGLLGVSVDITPLKLAEKALIEAKEKAEEVSRMKSEFIHNMEHDIRTPFAGIYGMSAILARQEMDPEKKEALELIADSSKELLEYANHILAFAQIEEEFNQVITKEFSVHKVVKSVIAMEKPAARNKGIKLAYTISESVPIILVSDEGRLKGILINLTSNAIKFTNEGNVTIEVGVAKKNRHNVVLSFKIKDTGIGIPKDKQKSIYDKFFRVNASNQGIYKGFGLGLQVVKKFVGELHGEINVESTLGKGTTFIVRLPFKLPIKPLL